MEDYTNKYKGEQVELALFGGEYQEGVLTAYCYVDEVAHIELNGHILVPLQNIASLHCSSRCDAQANEDWPPRGLLDEDGFSGDGRAAREGVEQETDRQCRPAIDALGDDFDELISILSAWGTAVRDAGGYLPTGPHELAGRR